MDFLTGIPSQDDIRSQVDTAAENTNKLIFHFDIDCFIALNNVYGHEAGDEVLAYFGDKIKQFFGDVQHGRYGGEEFAVILDNTEESVQRASDFLMFISGNLTYNDDPITISGGVAPGKVADPESGHRILKADLYTYKSKNGDEPPTKSYYNWRRSRDDYLNYPSYSHPIYGTPLQERYNGLKDTSRGGLKEDGKSYKFNRSLSKQS